MSAELETLLINEKWQGIFSDILSQYDQLHQLDRKATELEVPALNTVFEGKNGGLYCYRWVHPYQLIFSKRISKRRALLPWTFKTISEDILIYKCVDMTDPSWRRHGELRLESDGNITRWYVDVIWVDLEELGSVIGIAEWLKEVCGRCEEVIGNREAELQVSNEYFDSLADVAADNTMLE